MADAQTYFILLLVLSIGSNLIFPTSAILVPPITYLGILFIGFGLGLALWSRSLFLKKRTTLSPYEAPSSLLTDGPYQISRHPIYLGMASILFGTAIWSGSPLAFLSPILFILVIETVLIPLEEHKLEKIFGKRYKEYKRKVRPWF